MQGACAGRPKLGQTGHGDRQVTGKDRSRGKRGNISLRAFGPPVEIPQARVGRRRRLSGENIVWMEDRNRATARILATRSCPMENVEAVGGRPCTRSSTRVRCVRTSTEDAHSVEFRQVQTQDEAVILELRGRASSLFTIWQNIPRVGFAFETLKNRSRQCFIISSNKNSHKVTPPDPITRSS